MAGAPIATVLGPSAPTSGQPDSVTGTVSGDSNAAMIWYV